MDEYKKIQITGIPISGCPGPRGCKGERGKRGKTGATGANGIQGPTGATGPTGKMNVECLCVTPTILQQSASTVTETEGIHFQLLEDCFQMSGRLPLTATLDELCQNEGWQYIIDSTSFNIPEIYNFTECSFGSWSCCARIPGVTGQDTGPGCGISNNGAAAAFFADQEGATLIFAIKNNFDVNRIRQEEQRTGGTAVLDLLSFTVSGKLTTI